MTWYDLLTLWYGMICYARERERVCVCVRDDGAARGFESACIEIMVHKVYGFSIYIYVYTHMYIFTHIYIYVHM